MRSCAGLMRPRCCASGTVGEPRTRTLRSIYFDTPDHRLRGAGISFRLRSDGRRWVQTVKTGTHVGAGVSHPGELEGAVVKPEPDLKSVKDAKLRREIARVMHGSALGACLRDGGQAHGAAAAYSFRRARELALDEGIVRAEAAEFAVVRGGARARIRVSCQPAGGRGKVTRR